MFRHHTPAGMPKPLGNYSHGVEVPAGARLLLTSGQLGSNEGAIPDDVAEQARICFDNITRILASAGMTMRNVVRINAYLTDRSFFPAYMAVRDRYVASPPPASTLILVAGFARPEFKVEVEVFAADPR